MNKALYEKFFVLKESGRRTEAKPVLEEFIASFQTFEEKQDWTWDFLERGEYGHKIRHELYVEVLFPVLLEGYRRNDARSLFFLAKTALKLQGQSALRSQVDNKGEYQLLRDAYEIAPSEDAGKLLLNWYMGWFGDCAHEYPTGILYGTSGATPAECDELLEDIEFARTLDDGIRADYFRELEAQVREYRQRLQSKHAANSCNFSV